MNDSVQNLLFPFAPKTKPHFSLAGVTAGAQGVGLTLQGTQTVKKMTKNPTSFHPLIQDPLENFQT